MKKIVGLLLVLFICFAFSPDLQKRVFRKGVFDIECYISSKKVNYLSNKELYYWYKSGEIHYSQSNIGGNVLHNAYLKYYRSNQLAEKGEFNYGLKTGVWKSWYENGNLKERILWDNGILNGQYTLFNSNGKLILQGRYSKNSKVGKWIDYKTKDTIYYKKDTMFEERPKSLVERFLTKKDSLEKVQIKRERVNKKKADSIKRFKLKRERFIKKRNDSVNKAQEKIKKLNQKKLDSIEKAKNRDNGFLNRVFKKKDKVKE